MNLKIFFELFDEGHANHILWEDTLRIDKPMVIVLTLHLMCENFLEAWICSYVNIQDLFKEDLKGKDEKVKFNMPFQNKLKFAQRLGLPMPAYHAINKLNAIRNNFAHKLNFNVIENSQIKSISDYVESIKSESISHTLEQEGIEVYSESGEIEKRYLFSDITTPNTVKLVIMYGFLIRKLICDIRLLKK